MPRYVIHVGPHKTGSTYLQLAFHKLHHVLTTKGILYPRRWYIAPGSPNHRPLFTRLRGGGDERLTSDFAELNASKFDTILLSAEDLSDLSASSASLLKTLLGQSDVSVVFYCRRWSETLPSLWQEWIKQGKSFSFQEYYYSEIEHLEKSRIINFGIRLENLASAFGIKALKLVSYNNLLDQNLDILTHFMSEFLQIGEPPPVALKRANVSLSQMDTEMIRILNLLEWNANRKRGNSIRDQYLAQKNNYRLERFSLAIAEGRSFLGLDDAAPMFAALHASLFQSYGTNLVNPLGAQRLFEPKRLMIPYLSSDYLLFEGVIEEVREVYATISSSTVIAHTGDLPTTASGHQDEQSP